MLHGDPEAHLGPAFLRNTDPVGTVKFASGFGGVSACARSTAAARHTSTAAGVLKRCIARMTRTERRRKRAVEFRPMSAEQSEQSDSDWSAKVTHRFPQASFTVDRRYTPSRIIGMGAYGVVCRALCKTLDLN